MPGGQYLPPPQKKKEDKSDAIVIRLKFGQNSVEELYFLVCFCFDYCVLTCRMSCILNTPILELFRTRRKKVHESAPLSSVHGFNGDSGKTGKTTGPTGYS